MPMEFRRKLPIPKDVKEMYPLGKEAAAYREKQISEICDILTGSSDKKLLVIGPCSADSSDAVLKYGEMLCSLREKTSEKFLFVMRVYTGKPRTAGSGYKGMLFQPDPEKAPDPFEGVLAIRKLHTDILEKLGMPTADEMLYPADYRYLSDLLVYTTVGARSVENQEHRLVAGGLDIPVGMKNPISGSLQALANSVKAAQTGQRFIYRGWDVESTGNPYAHCVLRGKVNGSGDHENNCTRADIEKLSQLLNEMKIENPAFIADASHSNSGKNPFNQERNCRNLIELCRKSPEAAKLFRGFMIESYIFDGSREKNGPYIPGLSVTDACLGFEKTERLVLDLAEKL